MRRHAANWLEVAERVRKFRCDQLSEAQNQQLVAAAGDLQRKLTEKADASQLKLAIEKLEDVLRTVGGRFYPTSSLVENVEFFLVAAIVILGLRAYFVQPFKIPTNSMWPSYYGMTHEIFAPNEEPGLFAKTGRFLAFGATHYAAEAPADGEVLVPVISRDMRIIYSQKSGRTLGIFPTQQREYLFMVGGELTRITVPADFDFERVLAEKFGGSTGNLGEALQANLQNLGRQPESSMMTVAVGNRRQDQRVFWIPLGKTTRKGEKIVSFDILTGDLLFVDRFTYNFFPPKVGQGFVFKTGNIDELSREEGDKYFIKRLVGVPGDKLEIRVPPFVRDGGHTANDPAGQLFRNNAPITGTDAFAANAEKRGDYPGYASQGLLAVGRVAEVPAASYMALGDNSPRSKDSRYWGYVPNKDVVGKPLFIYYPLTKRWGVAR
ncbi:MAG: signal peptidase I [Candidatus Didemnitutus sp.]|nr:signal peptidase I [Candidatus Didemnitutus sp.]